MKNGLRVTFLLPSHGDHPIGGFKVVYEYANRLSRRGHSVSVVHPALLDFDTPTSKRPHLFARYICRLYTRSFLPGKWFKVDPAVRMLWRPSLSPLWAPNADVVIATAWQTAEWVRLYPSKKGKGYYLIQHFEKWSGSVDKVNATLKAPLKKIVIAQWLQQIAADLGEEAAYIPNGLDFAQFSVDVPPEDRNPHSVAMLYHDLDWKGSDDGIQALSLVREQIRDLQVTLFGIPPRPATLPEWIGYRCSPPQDELRDIYNSAAIFISPSWAEGWPLPPAEAMMSGAALVATDIGGHREYAISEKTALLSPAKDPPCLSANVLRLMRDTALRIQLAEAGNKWIQQYTWGPAVDAMEKLLREGSISSITPRI